MSKVQKSIEIYQEVNGVRKDFIARAVEELGMSLAGASTYFHNTKKRLSDDGEVSVKSSGKCLEDAKLYEVEGKDGRLHCFLNQEDADEFKMKKGA